MHILSIILGFQITLGVLEVVIFQIGAIILGFSIHFFFTSRKSINSVQQSLSRSKTGISEADEWRLKYYEQIDVLKKWEEDTRKELDDKQNHEDRLIKELEDTQIELEKQQKHEYILNKKLEEAEGELNSLKEASAADVQSEESIGESTSAYVSLSDHNHQIDSLLEEIRLLREVEQKHLDAKQANDVLQAHLRELQQALSEKEAEIKQIRHQQLLTHELNHNHEKAHQEYNILREKLQKLELQISKPRNRTFDYDELQHAYFKLMKECDEIKMKQLSMLEENHRLFRLLAETEDKLRESNFQRQQYLRKVSFLEELNRDLQEFSTHHKKLESQMQRIGEIETMLNRSVDARPKSD